VKAKLAAQQSTLHGQDSELLDDFIRAVEASTPMKIGERSIEVAFSALDGVHRLDALLHVAGHPGMCFAIEMKREAYPRDIKNALWQLDEFRRAHSGKMDVIPVVIANNLSPGSRELLRARNVAFYDASGSLFLRKGDVVIDIDRPPPPSTRARPSSLFTGAREQVVHALLHSHGEPINGTGLAEKSMTSGFTVSQTVHELERMEMVRHDEGRKRERRLVQPGALLDAWADAWMARDESKSRWFAFSPNPHDMPRWVAGQLIHHEVPDAWCQSGAAAGNAYAPLLTHVDVVDLVVRHGLAEQIAAALGAKRAEQGANLVMVERSGASELFRQPLPDGQPGYLASPFIVYLDLIKDHRGRNKELADELRARVLKV